MSKPTRLGQTLFVITVTLYHNVITSAVEGPINNSCSVLPAAPIIISSQPQIIPVDVSKENDELLPRLHR